jgi:uncharacterized membrane protein
MRQSEYRANEQLSYTSKSAQALRQYAKQNPAHVVWTAALGWLDTIEKRAAYLETIQR